MSLTSYCFYKDVIYTLFLIEFCQTEIMRNDIDDNDTK